MLRDGLTNPQIADRMGISLDGAKYHVSEIMGKLGASSRQEAALIRLEEYRPWWAAAFAPVAWLWRKMSVAAHPTPGGLATVAAAGLGVAAIGGLGLMAFLLLRDGDGDGSNESPPVALADELGVTAFAGELDGALASGDEQFLIDNVLYEDVTCLADVQGPPGNPEACAGLPAGSTTPALPVGILQSEGTYFSPADYGERVEQIFKSGSPELFAIAQRDAPNDPTDFLREADFERSAVAIIADSTIPEGEIRSQVVGFTLGYDGSAWHIVHMYVGGTNPFLRYEEPGPDEEWVRTFFSDWERWEPAG